MTWDFNCFLPIVQVNGCLGSSSKTTVYFTQCFFFAQTSRFSFKFMFFVKMCVCFFCSALRCYLAFLGKASSCAVFDVLFYLGEKRLYFVFLVAFRIRLRLGCVRFVLFVFQCGFHVVALFYTVFFFLVSIMHAKNTTTKHSK